MHFFSTCRVGVCQGEFPNFLLEAWDEYDFRKKSDNDRPSKAGHRARLIIYHIVASLST
jgi:hypothetical protein